MSVSQILDKIIKPEYRERFKNWESYATEKDTFGLECIEDIYSSHGKNRLGKLLPIQKQMYDTQESLMKRK